MVKSKANLLGRIERLEMASGAKDHIEIGTLEYDQPSMRFTFQGQVYDVDGLTDLFKEKPYLFLLAMPTDKSYELGFGSWVWLVGEKFKNRGYASVEVFLEILRSPPEPIDVLRGKMIRNE